MFVEFEARHTNSYVMLFWVSHWTAADDAGQ